VRDTTRDSRALYSVSLLRSGLPATSGSGRMPSVQALADSNRRPPPCHRATRPEPRAQAGHRGHESRARRRNRPKASDARTRRCPRWCSVSVPSLLPLESQSVRAGGPERLQGSRRYWLTRRLQRRESHMCLFRRLRPRPECEPPSFRGGPLTWRTTGRWCASRGGDQTMSWGQMPGALCARTGATIEL
jgi:hypothetical protein